MPVKGYNTSKIQFNPLVHGSPRLIKTNTNLSQNKFTLGDGTVKTLSKYLI
jgi:hypothetical protein